MDNLITSPGPQVSMTTKVGIDFGQNQIQRRIQSGVAQYFGAGTVSRSVTLSAGQSLTLTDAIMAMTAISLGTLNVSTTAADATVNTLKMQKLLHLDEGYTSVTFTNPTSGAGATDIQLILAYIITPPA